jgi:hypothetical protein
MCCMVGRVCDFWTSQWIGSWKTPPSPCAVGRCWRGEPTLDVLCRPEHPLSLCVSSVSLFVCVSVCLSSFLHALIATLNNNNSAWSVLVDCESMLKEWSLCSTYAPRLWCFAARLHQGSQCHTATNSYYLHHNVRQSYISHCYIPRRVQACWG